MRKTILTLCYGGAAVWFSIAVLGWLGILPLAMHPERWPIAAFGGMALLTFGVLFHQKLGVLLLVLVGFIAAPLAMQAECRDSRSQKECDLNILSQKLTEAGLPASPANIIGKAFCASAGGGSSWCGTVVGLGLNYKSWPGGDLTLRVETGSLQGAAYAIFDFEKKTWQVSNRSVDWVSVVTK